MRHAVIHRRLKRSSEHMMSMLMNLSISLVQHEQIRTTLPKAKELRPYFEKLVTLAKKENLLHAKRLLLSRIRDKLAVEKFLSVLAHRYKDRNGGYVRIMKHGFRRGDAAPMAIIELVDRDVSAKGKALKSS